MLRRSRFLLSSSTINTPPRTQVKGPSSSSSSSKRKLTGETSEPINFKFIFGVSVISLIGLFFVDPEPYYIFYLSYVKGAKNQEEFDSELKRLMSSGKKNKELN